MYTPVIGMVTVVKIYEKMIEFCCCCSKEL